METSVIVIIRIIRIIKGRDIERDFDTRVSEVVLLRGTDYLRKNFNGSVVAIDGEIGEAFNEGGMHLKATDGYEVIGIKGESLEAGVVELALREASEGHDLFF